MADPINQIFNKIEDLTKVGELSDKPFTENQLIDFVFIIINKYRAFRSDIREWICCPENKKKLRQLQPSLHRSIY